MKMITRANCRTRNKIWFNFMFKSKSWSGSGSWAGSWAWSGHYFQSVNWSDSL